MEIPTHSTESGFCGNQSLKKSFCWQIPSFTTLISIHKMGNLQTGSGLEISSEELHFEFRKPRKVFETHPSPQIAIVIPTPF